jgi:phospholipase D1/2
MSRRSSQQLPPAAPAPARILREGETCWRRRGASRVCFLVDGADYFEALAAALERAEHRVAMVGWDFHSRVALRRRDGQPRDELAEILDRIARRRRVRCTVLGWDFSMIYALERELTPLLRFGLGTHRRVRFHLDGNHPVGASHHQKIVVIDDALAFCGGLDLTACRWDTREHRAGDERRSDPGFPDYAPFHDVQVAVDGDAARSLGDLVRARWRAATGQRLRPVRPGCDPWPPELEPDLRDVEVGIARTLPAHEGSPEVREVEALYLEALRSARRCVFIENQYLTAHRVGSVLEERLREADGPEVVIVSPRRCSGWLEESTMGVLRARLVARLRRADRFGRLRVLFPCVPGLGSEPLTVHSKLLVVDDRLLRVGSANLSNRSMGLDSECDLAFEAEGEGPTARAITGLRDALLAEHLGVEPKRVAEEIATRGSLVAAVDALSGGERTLRPIEVDPAAAEEGSLAELVPASAIADPERPVELEKLVELFVPEEVQQASPSLLLRAGSAVALLLLLAAAWRFTPLGSVATPEHLSALASPLREGALGFALGLVIFVAAGLAMVPVTALIVAGTLTFGPLLGATLAILGSLACASAGYGLGRLLWRDSVRRLAGRRLNRLSRRLARDGVWAVAAVRVIPLAPFTVVNMVAGSSHLRFRDFALGTLIGMGPGTVALCLFAHGVLDAVRDPGLASLIFAGIVAALLGTVVWVMRRRLGPDEGDASPGERADE